MALNSKKIKSGGGDRVEQPVIEPGVYPSRIAQVIDLGLQPQRPYKGQDKPPAHEIMLTYELVDCFMVDKDGNELEDKPRWISEVLPLYNVEKADKAKCTQRYKAADPNNLYGGDFSQIIGTAVNVSLVHNQVDGKTYVNIASIAAMRPKDAEKCIDLKNPPKVFDLENPDMEVFGSLPDWVQEKIKSNLEFQGSPLQRLIEGGDAPVKEKKPDPAPAEEGGEGEEVPWD